MRKVEENARQYERTKGVLNRLTRTAGFILDHPIGRRHPVRCLGRLAAWQLRSRLAKGPHRIDYVGGTHFLAHHGEAGVSGNIYVGLHEFADMAFVAHALRPGDLFLDVGANAGSYTLLAAGWSGAQVIAIEPAPDAFARLRDNVRSNGLVCDVELHRIALGASEGTIAFTADIDTMNHVVTDFSETAAATIEVPLQTLDAVVGERHPCIIKLDVEGFECEVLEGASRMLADQALTALLVEILDDREMPATGRSSHNILRDAGFSPFRYDPWQRALTPHTRPGSGNVLFLRDAARFETCLRDARPLPVMGELV